MKDEFYIQVGLSTLRFDDLIFADIPLYIKVNELQENGLAKMENDLLQTIGEVIAKANAEKVIAKIEKHKECTQKIDTELHG